MTRLFYAITVAPTDFHCSPSAGIGPAKVTRTPAMPMGGPPPMYY